MCAGQPENVDSSFTFNKSRPKYIIMCHQNAKSHIKENI